MQGYLPGDGKAENFATSYPQARRNARSDYRNAKARRREATKGLGGPYGPNPTTLCEIDRILLRNRGPSNCKLNHAHLSVILGLHAHERSKFK